MNLILWTSVTSNSHVFSEACACMFVLGHSVMVKTRKCLEYITTVSVFSITVDFISETDFLSAELFAFATDEIFCSIVLFSIIILFWRSEMVTKIPIPP